MPSLLIAMASTIPNWAQNTTKMVLDQIGYVWERKFECDYATSVTNVLTFPAEVRHAPSAITRVVQNVQSTRTREEGRNGQEHQPHNKRFSQQRLMPSDASLARTPH
jgi:hypothetical protein